MYRVTFAGCAVSPVGLFLNGSDLLYELYDFLFKYTESKVGHAAHIGGAAFGLWATRTGGWKIIESYQARVFRLYIAFRMQVLLPSATSGRANITMLAECPRRDFYLKKVATKFY